MTDKWSKKRAAILKKYGGSTWAWHWRACGDLIVRNKTTGKVKNLGPIEPGPHRAPIAIPEIKERT